MAAANPTPASKDVTGNAVASRVLVITKSSDLGDELEQSLRERNCAFDYAAGNVDALRLLRRTPYNVVITSPATSIDEDLALLAEMRAIRPGVKAIVLACSGTPEEVIAALRARVFVCKTAPFDPSEIAGYAARAAASEDALLGIEVLSAHRDWVSLRMNCQILTAERLMAFVRELESGLAEAPREELMVAFREVLMNAIEHGAEFQTSKLIDVAAVHTARTIVFYVRDPGSGFRWESIEHAAVGNPPEDPTRHMALREEKGMRPGGFGILMARGIVDEMIYSEVGNEVLLIKHLS